MRVRVRVRVRVRIRVTVEVIAPHAIDVVIELLEVLSLRIAPWRAAHLVRVRARVRVRVMVRGRVKG